MSVVTGRRPLPLSLLVAAALVTAGTGGCGPASDGGGPSEDTVDRRDTVASDSGRERTIHEALAAHREAWMARPEVTGVGIGRCGEDPCIVIYVLRRFDAAEPALPDSVDGHPVRLEVTGGFEAGGGAAGAGEGSGGEQASGG